MSKNIIIGIAGGTASGKSTLAEKLLHESEADSTTIIKLDDYYLDQKHLSFSERVRTNYDHPKSFDVDLLVKHLKLLQEGTSIEKPTYDFVNHVRATAITRVTPTPVIILEGILIFAIKPVLDMIDFKIFVDTPADVRLLRRVRRDMEERGRDLNSIINQYLSTVRPMHDLYVEPSKVYADIIVPEGGYNRIATDLLLTNIDHLVKLHHKENDVKNKNK